MFEDELIICVAMNVSETKLCQNCRQEFGIAPDDPDFYANLGVPVPDQCPQCRWKRQLSFWIFGKFRKTKSDLSGKSIITTLPERMPFVSAGMEL